MQIKEVIDKEKWEDYVLEAKGSFLQSWQWGEIKKKWQNVIRIGWFENNSLKGVCQIFEEKLPFGNYFYCPYGPIVRGTEDIDKFIKKLEEFSQDKADFIRFEPLSELKRGSVAFNRHQPKKTLLIDLKEEKDLLSGFDSSVRYSVRRAQREGVQFQESKNIDQFYELLQAVAKKHSFHTYSKDYFEKIVNSEIGKLFVASHNNEIVMASICIFFGDTVTYLHTGTDYKKRKLRASGFTNFKIMSLAYQKGFKKYDFWGIDKEKMPGVTKFKKDFGGKELIYPPAKDFSTGFKYNIYKTAYKCKHSLMKVIN